MAKAKLISRIDCDGAAVASIARVLTTRFDEMCALRDAALDWSDPEGVHDMRVASRRLRGVLQDFMPYLKKRRFADCLADIKLIASALGRVRDHDVALITLAETAAKAPAEIATGINRLIELRQAALEEERAKLILALDPQSLLALKDKLTNALADISSAADSRASDSTPDPVYRQIAVEIISNRLEKFLELSQSLYTPLKVKPLHKLRIAAKLLRYALELFEQCIGPAAGMLASKVAGIQSSLGKLHDCDVWLQDFGEAAMANAANIDSDQQATSIWLIRHFTKLRSRHFGRALSQWHEWEKEDLSARLQDCIQQRSNPTA